MTTPAALANIRVIELCDERGEWCGKLFSGMGAEVIKIEPPDGSPTRRIGPFVDDVPHPDRSLFFWYYNTNKRSVTLDLDTDQGRDWLRRLIADADVLIDSLGPGYLAARGLDVEMLCREHPRLIGISITPFGRDGPYREYQMTDLTQIAMSPICNSCGYDGDSLPPVRPGQNHAYHTACHYAYLGALVALVNRELTGLGQFIDVAIHDACCVTSEFATIDWFYNRKNVHRQTGRHADTRPTAPTQILCGDGRYINLAHVVDEGPWQRLVDWLDSEGMAVDLRDERFRTYDARVEQASYIYDVLAAFALTHTSEELFHGAQQRGLTWGAIRAPEDWLTDPHAEARGFFQQVEHPELGRTITYPGAPYLFHRTPWRIGRRAPLLGEDTEAVLGQLGETGGETAG
jgi:crotonobetainyl-CoA:carnitine CoA-transferase CaiB-like acyl-CoA transferase